MRQNFPKHTLRFLSYSAILCFVNLVWFQHSNAASRTKIEITPLGLDEAEQERVTRSLLSSPEVRETLGSAPHHLISTRFEDENAEDINSADPLRTPFRIDVYDYARDLLWSFHGHPTSQRSVNVVSRPAQPEPTDAEFAKAVEIVAAHRDFARGFQRQLWRPYRAMPGIVIPVGFTEAAGCRRVVPIGLRPLKNVARHEIVAVDLSRRELIRYPKGAPPDSIATRAICGRPDSNQASTRKGTSGSALVRVRRDDTTTWEMTVVRPSASSGDKGSGIELRGVRYRGQRLLSRLHAPIMNVRYSRDVCGPYRDWLYSEHPFRARGARLASGVLRASTRPTTILDSGVDRGDFRGVAVYEENGDLILVSELAAGWYRYVVEYRFTGDGRILPRYRFTSVENSCTCNPRTHHVYWRIDFDLTDGARNRFETKTANGGWTALSRESVLRRELDRAFRVTHAESQAAIEILPGANDGTATSDSYGLGDIFVVRNKSGEIDDARHRRSTRAAIDAFVDGERLEDENLVVWYGAHLYRPGGEGAASVGPTLKVEIR